jgi:hypothetical protein
LTAGAEPRDRALRFWEWFFPPEVRLAPEAAALLRRLYPSLRLERIRFHRGLPHAVRALGSVAITLPALWVPRRTRIYFEPRVWAPGSDPSIEGLGTLAHEAYHALQIQETAWGAGPFRPFLWLYFACGAANGFRYHDHPMEHDAYRLAGRSSSSFEAALLNGGGGKGDALDFDRAHTCAEPLACASAGVDFWRRMAGTTPGVGSLVLGASGAWWPWALLISPPAAVWFGTWVLAATVAWLALALLEIAGVLFAGPFLLLSRALVGPRGESR